MRPPHSHGDPSGSHLWGLPLRRGGLRSGQAGPSSPDKVVVGGECMDTSDDGGSGWR